MLVQESGKVGKLAILHAPCEYFGVDEWVGGVAEVNRVFGDGNTSQHERLWLHGEASKERGAYVVMFKREGALAYFSTLLVYKIALCAHSRNFWLGKEKVYLSLDAVFGRYIIGTCKCDEYSSGFPYCSIEGNCKAVVFNVAKDAEALILLLGCFQDCKRFIF